MPVCACTLACQTCESGGFQNERAIGRGEPALVIGWHGAAPAAHFALQSLLCHHFERIVGMEFGDPLNQPERNAHEQRLGAFSIVDMLPIDGKLRLEEV